MRSNGTLKRTFAMALVYAMLIENVSGVMPAAYAEDAGDGAAAETNVITVETGSENTADDAAASTETPADNVNVTDGENEGTQTGAENGQTNTDDDKTVTGQDGNFEIEENEESEGQKKTRDVGTSEFTLLINGAGANGLTIAYGQPLTFSLAGHTGSEEVYYNYATPENAQLQNWENITDGICTIEPGEYIFGYSTVINEGWVHDESFAVTVVKGTVGAPGELAWNGSRMTWSAPAFTDLGGALDSGVIEGYELRVYRDGAEYTTLTTAADQLSYNNFENNIKDDGGAGSYTFTVQAMVDGNGAHYSGAAVSPASGAYTVPEAELVALPGTSGLKPDAGFLLLPGNEYYNSQSISAEILPGYRFDHWEGSGVSFADANAASTEVTVNDGYAGETALKIYAAAKDVSAPAVTAFAANAQGTLTASAYDEHSGIAAYAFSTAAAANAVPADGWQSVTDPAAGEKSFEFAPASGGEYYFHVMDADGNTASSENSVSVTQVQLKNWDNIGESGDKAVFLTGEYTTLPTPVSAGYIFGGWYESEDFAGDAVTAPEHSTGAALTFYAKWAEETLDVPDLADIIQVYDAKKHTLSVSLGNTGRLVYQWYRDGQKIEGANGASITVRNVSDSGRYSVNVRHYNARGDLLGEGSSEATVDISPREVIVAPRDTGIVYGEALPDFTAEFRPVSDNGEVKENTGLVAGDEASITAGTFGCAYERWGDAGSYAVTASGFASDNYDISYASGTLTVAEREYPNGISAEIVFDDEEERWFVYTGEEIRPALRITDTWNNNSLLTEGKDYTLEYVNNVGASSEQPAVNITFAGSYSGSESLKFEIRRAGFEALTVMDGWTYGDEPSAPSVSGNVSGGEVSYTYLKTADGLGNAVEGGAETDARPTDAGTYRVTAHIAGNENFEAVDARPCDFTIARRVITITTESFTFEYDGLPHSYREYEVDGDFAAGEGFKYITVTGEQTNVTEGVDNTVEYELNSAAKAENYKIVIVCGKLVVRSVMLTVPSNSVWQSAKPGTATWVAVSKDGLTAQYELQLYAAADGVYRAVGDAVTVTATAYDFSDAIRADAAAHPGASYSFTIKTVPVGENAGNYEASDVSEKSGELYTVTVYAAGDENVNEALLCREGTTEKTASLVLIDGESASLSASAKPGYSVMAWTADEGLTLGGLTVTAALTQSLSSVSVTAHTADNAPEITAYTAVNTGDYKVELRFTVKDAVGLAGWLIQTSAVTPDENDEKWEAISGTEYSGVYTPAASGRYYLFVKDTAGSIVCSASVKTQTDPETGEIIQVFTPEYRGVNAITLAPGEGASGDNKVIFKAENTTIALPTALDCGFVNDGFAFRNWYAGSGIYEDEGKYGANRDEVLTATWTNQHFDYSVEYYYMNTDGDYPDAPEYTAKFSALYGTKVSSGDEFLQRARTGFTPDDSEGCAESIELKADGLSLRVFYKRNLYTVTYRYTMPGDENETVKTAQYLYGAELGEALFESAKPQAEGYTFVGWSFDGSEHMPATMPANNVTASGEFIPKQGSVHLRFFMQELDGESYAINESMSREISFRHGEEITVNADKADAVEGFTYAAACVSYGSEYDGGAMPDEAKAELTGTASAADGKELYINLFYKRNEYTVTLEVWQGDVGDGKIKYTNSWKALYGADLTDGADGKVTAEMMESYEREKWEHDDGYVLAALVAWSTGERPETMPAGDVKVSRQFIPKIAGKFKVELWTEGETEGEYSSREFTYLGNVGTKVNIGSGEGFTVDYTKLANAVPGFEYYDYKEISDESVHGGTVTSAVVTDTNNGAEPVVLRIFFERKTVDITLNFYEVNESGQTKIATATKKSKWGSSYKYDYELLSLFYSSDSFDWNETPESFSMTGTPSAANYCAGNYVVSYSAYHNLNDNGHWSSGTLNTVESLGGTYTDTVGVKNTYVNVYYIKADVEKQQYYLNVVYNARDLSYGENKDVPVTYTVDGTEYKVRMANAAYFYSDAVYVPDTVDDRYPGLAYYNVGSGESGGHFEYGTLRDGVQRAGNYYIEGEYIYIPLADNRLFNGNFTSCSYGVNEIGNDVITAFLDDYKAAHPDNAGAQGAYVYNRSWGRTIVSGNGTLTVTFRNGPTYHIYYNVNGNVCAVHEFASGSEIESVGCGHGIYTPMEGYEIVWYRANHEELKLPFTLNGDITLYGEYEKADVGSTEYAYYELADHELTDGAEVAYITADNRGSFELTESVGEDGTVTYTYKGSVVMVERPIVSESFTEISMDAARYAQAGFAYDSANSANRLKGYVAAKPIALSAYFIRNEHSLSVDSAVPDTNVQLSRVRFGQSVELGVLSRSGYTFAGWKVTDDTGAELDEKLITRNEDGSASVICPDADITAIAQWTPAEFTQTVIHYYQKSDLSFDKAAVAEMMSDDSAADIEVNGNPGKKYKNGGVSYTADGKTYYYNSAELADGVYVLRPENLSAVVCEVTVTQDKSFLVRDGIVSADKYDYSFTVHKSGAGDIVKLDENGSYINAVDMEVEYYYTLQGGYSLSLSAECTGAAVPDVTFTGAGEDYYYSENVTVSAALPAGYVFDGWRENGVIFTTDMSFTASMTEDRSFVAVMHALPVSDISLKLSGVEELVYGYPMSETNAVGAAVEILDADTENYVKSYCWYIADENGNFVPVAENGSSASYKIPTGWQSGDYTLKCFVTVARRDNGLERSFESAPYGVSVVKADMTVGCTNYSGVFDGKAHSVTLSVAGMSEGTDYTVYYADEPLTEDNYASAGSTKKLEYTDAGDYTVFFRIHAENGNLNDYSGSGTVKITPKLLTVSAGGAVYHKTYDGTETVRGAITEQGSDMNRLCTADGIYEIHGLVGTDSMDTYAVSGNAEFNSKDVRDANMLTFSGLQLVNRSTGDVNCNYYFAEGYEIVLSAYIDRMPLTLLWTDTELGYNGAQQLPGASITDVLPDGDSLDVAVSGAQTTAGTYTASANITAGNDKTDVNNFTLKNGSQQYVIGRVAITIAPVANTVPITYDGNGHTLTEFELRSGELLDKQSFTAKPDRTEKDAGEHDITAKDARVFDAGGIDVTDNFDLSYESAVLTIARREVTVSGLLSADKSYDGSTDAAVNCGSVSFGNIVEGDELALDAEKIGAAFNDAKVGDGKTVTFTVNDGALTGRSAGNYLLDLKNSGLTATASITRAEIIVTAKDVSTVYGEDAGFDVSFSGFVGGEGENVVSDKDSITYTIRAEGQDAKAYDTKVPAGEYEILADVSRLAADNYSFKALPGTLTVEKRPITVGAAENALIEKVYDGTAGASADSGKYVFGAVPGNAASGLVPGDGIGLDFKALYNSKNVDEAKTVTFTDLGITNPNYTLETESFTVPGKISPAPLTVKVNDREITYGDAKPSDFTVSASGFVNGETLSVILLDKAVFTCEYDSADSAKRAVKDYAVSVSGAATEHGNYKISYADGTLTVKKAVITVTAVLGSSTAVYGTDPIPSVGFESTGYKYGESFDTVVRGDVAYDYGSLKEVKISDENGEKTVISSKPGVYSIVPVVSGLSADNYTFAAAEAKLTVDKYVLRVYNIAVKPRVYDGTANVYDSQIDLTNVQTDGLLTIDRQYFEENKDELIVVSAEYTGDGAENVGTGKNVSIGITFRDYLNERCYVADKCQDSAVSEITARPLRISADDKQTLYGTAAPAFTVTYGKTVTDGAEDPDSGFAPGESAEISNVTVNCEYKAADGEFSDAGDYDIAVSDFTGSDTALPANYAPQYHNGTLTVRENKLASPAVSWDEDAPGLVKWQPSASVGNVYAESYTAVLYKDGAKVDGSAATLPAGETLQADFAELIRGTGAGAYTVEVTANASEENNAGKKNVLDSDPGRSGSLSAARVRFVFASDAVTESGKGGSIGINGMDSYVMLAGEENAGIAAALRIDTGYTVKSVTADNPKLTVSDGTDTARTGDRYEDTVSLAQDFSGAAEITVTLALNSIGAEIGVVVEPRPGENQASCTYGYSAGPVLTATVTPVDGSTGYTYEYVWEIRYNGIVRDTVIHTKTEAADEFAFPTGKRANTDPAYYQVRCIVTATRDDNGNSYSCPNAWTTAVDYVTNVTVNRATFEASVSMDGWTYGDERNAPTLDPGKVSDNEAINGGRYVFLYKRADAPDESWSAELPTDAGRYQVKAYIPTDANYEEFTTEAVDFEIKKAKLAAPTNLTMAESDTAPYGLISWDSVDGVKENGGNEPESEVSVTYTVRLYSSENDANPKVYPGLSGCSLDITDDLQTGGIFYYTVTAVSSNETNCENSGESERYKIAVNGTIDVENASKMYDGESVTLTAVCGNAESYEWYKGNEKLNLTAESITALHAADSGSYTCVIRDNFGTVYTPKASVSITKRSVTLTSATDTKVYDAAALTNGEVTVSGDGFAKNEGADYTVTGSRTDVGTCDNSFTYTLSKGTDAGDYVIKTVNGKLTVKARTIADGDEFDIEQPSDVVYRGSAFTPKPAVRDLGLSGGAERTLTEGVDYTYSYEDNVNAGTATVTINGTGNYEGTVSRTFGIAKRPVLFVGETKTVEYNGALQELTEIRICGADGGDADENSGLAAEHTHNVTYSAKGTEASGTPYQGTITEAGDVRITANGADVTNNYTVATKAGTLTIETTDADWSVTLEDDTLTYNGQERESSKTPVPTAATGKVTYSYSYTKDGKDVAAPKDAGTYTVSVTAANPNYKNTAKTTATLTINPAVYNVSTDGDSKVYDGTPLTAGGVVSGIVSGESVTFNTTGSITDAGITDNTYTIEWDHADENNYVIGTESLGKLEVTPAKYSVKTYGAECVYNGEALTAGGEITGIIAGERDIVRLNTTGSITDAGSANNTYKIEWNGAESANYELEKEEIGVLKVTKKSAVITVSDASKVYGDKDPEFTHRIDGLIGNDTLGTVSCYRTGKDEAAGVYKNVLTAGCTGNDNYDVTVVNGTFTIEPSNTLTVSAENVSVTYDAATHSGAPKANIAEGTTLSYSTDGGVTWSKTLPKIRDAGSMTVTVRAENANYVTAECSFTVTVSPRAATISVHDKSKVYGDKDPEFTGDIDGLLGSDTLGTVTYYRTNSDVEAAGEYTGVLDARYTGNPNYTVTVKRGKFTITQADGLLLSANDVTATYDGKPHYTQPTVNITEGTTITYSTDGGKTYSGELPKLINAGSLSVRAKAENRNHAAVTADYTILVNPAEVTVTAQAMKKTYGDNDPASFKAVVNGMVNDESPEEKLSYRMSRAAGENVGEYTVSFTGDETQGNYHLTFVGGVFTIEARALEPVWSIRNVPDDGEAVSGVSSVTYDGKDKTAVAVFANLVTRAGRTDDVAVSGYTGDLKAQTVGSYHTEITGITGRDSGNYVLADRDFDWSITARPLSGGTGYAEGIRVEDVDDVPYDGTWHTPEVTVTDELVKGGMKLKEGTDYTVAYSENRNAGAAKITITGKGNYKMSIVKTFTVLPKAVTLSWDKSAFDYNGEYRSVHAVVTNAVAGDSVTVGSCGGSSAVDRGSYTATVYSLGGDSAGNYTLSGAEGVSQSWVISPARLSVRADDKTSELGAPMQELTYTLTGTVYGKDVPGRFVLTTAAKDAEGSFPIIVNVENANPNYEISVENGVYTLTAAKAVPDDKDEDKPEEQTKPEDSAAEKLTDEVPEGIAGLIPESFIELLYDILDGLVPNGGGEQNGHACVWHRLIILADLIFALGLALTMRREKADTPDDKKRRHRKRSMALSVCGFAVLMLVCVFSCILGFCRLELPLTVISGLVMGAASALLYRRKFAEKEETAESV